jgi:hypothetical protein
MCLSSFAPNSSKHGVAAEGMPSDDEQARRTELAPDWREGFADLLLAPDDLGLEHVLQGALWNSIEGFAVRTANRYVPLGQPVRYPHSHTASSLGPRTDSRRRPLMCPR